MRPLHRRKKQEATASSTSTYDKETGTYSNGDLKATVTNGSGNGMGVGEVEALSDVRSDDELLDAENEYDRQQEHPVDGAANETATAGGTYKVYKRRWFGLVQLVLLNIIVSWDVSAPNGCRPALR